MMMNIHLVPLGSVSQNGTSKKGSNCSAANRNKMFPQSVRSFF